MLRALLAGAALFACTAPAAAQALGAGDSVRITVFQNPDLSVEARLSERGTVSYPLLGEVALGGQTPAQAGAHIAGELRRGQFLRDPQVSVALVQLRSRQVSVLGQVARPGRYPLEEGSASLTDILALAGGISPGGADTVTVTGTRDGAPVQQRFDVPALIGAGADRQHEVQPGDTVYVPRAPQFYVYGEVQRAGAYRLEPDLRVMGALSLGGGLTPRGTQRAPRIHRRMPDGSVQVLEARLTDAVQPDDVIYFRESLF